MSETTPKNVVHFDKPGKAGHGASLISECRNIASGKLAESLSDMMGRVDDALFELAEKAQNNIEQSHYFDAMRDVRLKRSNIESEFKKQLIERCNLDSPMTSDQSMLKADNELSLVEDNLLETSLAVSNMVAKANYLCKDELFALEQRIAHLLRMESEAKEGNPLDPVNICNAFKDACNELDSDIKVKLIILKLFEKYVIKDLKGIYREINLFLAQNNILPVINYAIRSNAAAETAINDVLPETCMGNGGDQPGADLFSSLQALIKANASSANTGTAPAMASSHGMASGIQTVSIGDMLTNLTMLQRGKPGHMFGELSHFDTAQTVAGTNNVLRELKSRNVLGEISSQENYTIDIVAMLFDYILDDHNIPDRMKAIIGRLQIPVLKVVMMDRTFFSKKRHPVRSLLDTLSRAAIGLDESDDEIAEAIYAKADGVVHKILNEFEDDLNIFQDLLHELNDFLDDISRQTEEKIEQTRRELEQQTLHHNAGIIANQEVRKRIDTADIDPVVREFLNEYWSRLLMISYLRDQGDCASLQGHVDTMDKLIWSVLPKHNPEERRELVDTLPMLLGALNEGMDSLEMPAHEREAFFTRLARCHSKAVSNRNRAPAIPPAHDDQESDGIAGGEEKEAQSSGETTTPENSTYESTVAREDTEAGGEPQENEAAPSSTPASASDIMAQIEQGSIEVEEITLGNGPDTHTPPPIEDEFTEQVRGLEKGSWVAFKKDDDALTHEKLLWINTVTGMYMFTNRNGHNTRNLSLHQLAEAFRLGRAETLEEDELIDRAVNNLVITLRRA